jgi:hypothetical protein
VRGVSASELDELPEAGESGSVMVMKSRIKIQVSGYAIAQADTWTTGKVQRAVVGMVRELGSSVFG